MQFTRTLIPRALFTCKLPESRTSSSSSNCTRVLGWIVTVDPSASIFAVLSFRVCTRSYGKIAEELGAGFPFSQAPPSLWSIARPRSCPGSDAEKTMIIKTTIIASANKLAPF